jgi:hypothetical protein
VGTITSVPAQDGLFFGVQFEDVAGYTEEFGSDGIRVSRPVKLPWNDRLKLVNDALGSVFQEGTHLRRRLPAQHPIPQMDRLFCTSITGVTGKGTVWNDGLTGEVVYREGQTASPGYCYCTLNYSVPPYILRTDAAVDDLAIPELGRHVERVETHDVTTVPLPGTALKWTSGGAGVIRDSTFKLFPSRELVYVWHDVPKVPWTNIDLVVGKVNVASFDGTAYGYWNTYAAETLLCLTPKVERVEVKNPFNPKPDGVYWNLFRITYRFLWRPDTHNRLFRLSTGQFEDFRINAPGKPTDGTKVFPTADFGLLFTPVL